jgi:hypothetical protein
VTDEVVHYGNREHIKLNSMYVTTLKVAKARRALTSVPKFAGIAHFGPVGANNYRGGGGGGTSGGGAGVEGANHLPGWTMTPPAAAATSQMISDTYIVYSQ